MSSLEAFNADTNEAAPPPPIRPVRDLSNNELLQDLEQTNFNIEYWFIRAEKIRKRLQHELHRLKSINDNLRAEMERLCCCQSQNDIEVSSTLS